jgi:glyoxylase-like metal-dependent hydrolase (beta-lactamase superfamily II)
MKRIVLLGVLVVVCALSTVITAQQPAGGAAQQAAQPRNIEVEKLKDNLFVLRHVQGGPNGGGNTAVFVTSTGVVVVDTKNPGWGQPILNKIRELTEKPITTIINTHTHGDHVSGNVEFSPTVEVIVHENTKANMDKMIPNSTAADQTVPKQTIFQLNNGRGLPKRTFKDKMTIFKGPDAIDLFYFGRGHTNGDAFVVFPALRIAHFGDIFSGKNLPLLDANNGGSAALIATTLQRAHDTLQNVDTIITGHNPQMTKSDLREYIAFNREFFAEMESARKAGKTIDDVAATWKIPAKYKGYAEPAPERLKNNVRLAFMESEKGVKN